MNDLTAKEICAIIKVCRDCQVSSLELGILKVSFGDSYTPVEALPFLAESTLPTNKETPTINQDDSSHLMLSDPEKYEQILFGDLELNEKT